MRNRNTIEFLGIWEQLFNPSFNPLEFEGFRMSQGQVNDRMSQGQVNDIKNNTLADVTVTGHWHHDFQFLRLTVLQLKERKNRFRILKTRGQVSVSWTMPIHTRRYSLTVDSFQKRIFALQITDNSFQKRFFCVTSVTVDSWQFWEMDFFGGVASQEIFGGNLF